MKKVGILSMQRIKNYGSFLQAYGLKKTLENLNCKVEFVDYRVEEPIVKDNNTKNDRFHKALTAIKGNAPLIQKLQYIKHKKNFGKKYYQILGLTEESNYTPDLDLLVIGSDEVFNCIQKNKNVGYSLELFGKNNNAKKLITYAASFGNTTLEKLQKYNKTEELSNLLSNFDSISVRDENSAQMIKKLTKKDVVYHLDPVLIYNYPNQVGLIPQLNVSEKYIIVYAYNNRISKKESAWIKQYAKKNKLKVYAIGGAQKCADKFIDCSPFEVLAYFKNAEFIITDTFHGSIFSIIMHKKFVTLVRKSIGNEYGNEEKLTDLLKRLNLEDRITFNIEDVDKILEKEMNYNKVEEIIKNEREKTIKYLEEQINVSDDSDKLSKDCSACGACYNICPKNAITMKEDENGFLHPVIDKEKCVNCGLCKKVCNYNIKKEEQNKNIKTYAAISKDKELLKKSASGGIFATIASNVLKADGVVYGCSMEKNAELTIKHIRVTKLEELKKIQGSKYVQSEIGNTYKLIKKDLEDNKIVLFSGTPCQVDGLYGYLLGKKYDNLFTIDIICHGVPSQQMFKDYIKNLEQKINGKILTFDFRNKTKGWGLYAKYTYEKNGVKKQKVIPAYNSSFYQLFLDSLIYRENCYKCPYAANKRVGNITIGDFWGIEEEHPKEIETNKIQTKNGISCIIINDIYGDLLVEKFGTNLSLIKSKFEKVAKHNNQLKRPSSYKKAREITLNIYSQKGYEELDKWYFKNNKSKILLKKIWWKLPNKLKNKIKKG